MDYYEVELMQELIQDEPIYFDNCHIYS
jgi:hypothetical protein